MSDPFVAEIRIFPFNFAPRGWAFCDGQLMILSQNTALFSLLGTTYGGNGMNNFGVPNLQGRVPMQPGQGPGLSLYDLGQEGGVEYVTLLESEIPAHAHALRADTQDPGDNSGPGPTMALGRANIYQSTTNTNRTALNAAALAPVGSGQPHNNMQPYLTLNFCIALQGIFPPRS